VKDPTTACEGCGETVLSRDTFLDPVGRTLCRGCKGKQDFAAAQETSRGKGLQIPYRVIGIGIAMVALLPLVVLRARGRLGIEAIAYVVVALIVVIDVVVSSRRR
jgi:hypothetical protein